MSLRAIGKRMLPAMLGFIALVAVSIALGRVNGTNLMGSSAYDTYALQADAWRAGSVKLDRDYPHLELALYGGEFYVSFPPFPSVPIFLLKYIMPGEVPSGLLTLIYFLLCYPSAYGIARRRMGAWGAAALALAVLAGGTMLDVAVSSTHFAGSVWYQAQTLSLLLTLLAFWGVGHRRVGWRYVGWAAIALAVGCRPFQAIYIPVLLWEMVSSGDGPVGRRLLSILPMWIIPACIASALCWYNWIRFGSLFEFGHNYLPEFTRSDHVQFSLAYIPRNLMRVLRPPFMEELNSGMPLAYGFAIYATNPMLVNASCSVIRRRPDTGDIFLMLTLTLHLSLLLMHGTFGGWQYGTRYACDLLPGLLALRSRSGNSPGAMECVYLFGLMILNIAGIVMFHIISGE